MDGVWQWEWGGRKAGLTRPKDLQNVKCKGKGKVKMSGFIGDFGHGGIIWGKW